MYKNTWKSGAWWEMGHQCFVDAWKKRKTLLKAWVHLYCKEIPLIRSRTGMISRYLKKKTKARALWESNLMILKNSNSRVIIQKENQKSLGKVLGGHEAYHWETLAPKWRMIWILNSKFQNMQLMSGLWILRKMNVSLNGAGPIYKASIWLGSLLDS